MEVVNQEKLVPLLRFNEFNETWKTHSIYKIFNITAGGDISKRNVNDLKTDIFKYPIYANAKAQKGLYGYSDIYKIEPNVITIAGRGVYLGIAHARRERFYPIVRLLVLKPKHECDIDFFENRINLIKLYIESTGVPQLTAPQIGNYKVSFPCPTEQEKIASFITSVDDKIQKLKRKNKLLKEYKKGIMQKIFSQEIRFKDENGNDYPDWEEKKLGDTTTIKKGEQLNKSELTDTGRYPALNGGINPSGYTNKWNTLPNTITISEGGNSCGYVNLSKTKFWCGGHCYALLEVNPNLDNHYIFQFLKYNENKIMRLRVGSGLPNIQKKDVNNFLLKLPLKKEQKKIASFLSSIDNKIESTESQLEQTKVFKKGLLQQMFV
tara:strand:- start:178 stop:1314 length:1137 start_codon:yes stop_codon:yes gene_type:complete